jgi:hypothetical protein
MSRKNIADDFDNLIELSKPELEENERHALIVLRASLRVLISQLV